MRIILIILLTGLLSCNHTKFSYKDNIHINQMEMSCPITLRADTANNQVFKVHFRIPFQITNSSTETRYIRDILYFYRLYEEEYSGGWSGTFSVYCLDSERTTISGILKEKVNKRTPIYIYIYTAHGIDTTEQTQLKLRQYLEKMKMQHTDTLSIPFNEFKKKHGQLITNLLKGDSISLLIEKDINKYDELGDTIMNIPIRY